MFEKRKKNGITYYTSTLLEEYGFKNAFCTKSGGVSKGCFDSLNMSFTRKDENGVCDNKENVIENYRRALIVVGSDPFSSIAAKQVHKNSVIIAGRDDAGLEILRESDIGYDAVVVRANNEKVNCASVKTADCVPILFCNTKTGDACACHAGWRGTMLDIVTRCVETLGGNPKDIVCAIGPSIAECCYEVGDEVYLAAKKLFKSKDMQNRICEMFINTSDCSCLEKRRVSLSRINQALLEKLAVPEENIEVSDICTCCTKDDEGNQIFFSHRGQKGYSGTFLSVVRTRKE